MYTVEAMYVDTDSSSVRGVLFMVQLLNMQQLRKKNYQTILVQKFLWCRVTAKYTGSEILLHPVSTGQLCPRRREGKWFLHAQCFCDVVLMPYPRRLRHGLRPLWATHHKRVQGRNA